MFTMKDKIRMKESLAAITKLNQGTITLNEGSTMNIVPIKLKDESLLAYDITTGTLTKIELDNIALLEWGQ